MEVRTFQTHLDEAFEDGLLDCLQNLDEDEKGEEFLTEETYTVLKSGLRIVWNKSGREDMILEPDMIIKVKYWHHPVSITIIDGKQKEFTTFKSIYKMLYVPPRPGRPKKTKK